MKAQYPRKRRRRRKCQCCRELYMPNARHFHDQTYCTKPECRHAGKLASHRRWYFSEKGREYRDPEENKRRVREWRKEHPKYWRHTGQGPEGALPDTIAETSRRLVLLGQDILGIRPGNNPKGGRQNGNRKTSSMSRAHTAGSPRI